MAEFRLTFDNLRDQYPADKFITLLPTVSKHIVAARPMYSLDVTTVKINPDDKNHVYAVEFEGYGEKRTVTAVALAKVAIDLLAAACDADVIVGERYTPRTGPLFASFGAVASMRQPGGEVRSRTASVDWDGELIREKLQLRVEEYVLDAVASGWKGKSRTGVAWKDLDDKGKQENIRMRFTSQWLDEREFGKRKAESKAARNALKSLLAMPSTYDPRELRNKEFAVAKLVLTPDLSDPQVRAMLMEQGNRSQAQLWGATVGASFFPQPQTQFHALPPGDAVDYGKSEPADDPVADPVDEAAATVIEPITWEAAEKLVPEIMAITANWPGAEKDRDPLVKRFTKAYAARDGEMMANIHNYCLDAKLAAESGGQR
jgi:hypothetical protein